MKMKIINFFEINTTVINNKSSLENEEIFILQFNGTKNLLFSSGKILDIKNIYEIIYIFHNLLNATNLMFYRCRELNDLDLSNFYTENVINMSWMFNKYLGCLYLVFC